MTAGAGNTADAAWPNTLINAESSNSPTTFGLMFSRSNHSSRLLRSAVFIVGSSTGADASDAGNFDLTRAARRGGAKNAIGDSPSKWLNTFTRTCGGAGASAMTTS